MAAGFTEDQHQFRDVVAKFLSEKSTPGVVRQLMASETGFDPGVWQQMCVELGLSGIHIPEVYGGAGFGATELGITTEEMGRYLYCGPFFSSPVMAGYGVLIGADDKYKAEYLPDIASGSCIASLVLDDLNSPAGLGSQLQVSGSSLSGAANLVLDAHNADLLVIVANSASGRGLFVTSPKTTGIVISPQQALDPTRKLNRVEFQKVAVEKIGDLTPQALTSIWQHICVALAHEMIGGAQHLLDSTVEYTKMRVQFGRPIGSFQSLKHRCADLLMELEFARAATHHAAHYLDGGEGEAYLPNMVKAMASDVYMNAARTAIQLRGGIGFTWEDDTHLWFKRAKSSEVFMGSPYLHREQMMTFLEANQ